MDRCALINQFSAHLYAHIAHVHIASFNVFIAFCLHNKQKMLQVSMLFKNPKVPRLPVT